MTKRFSRVATVMMMLGAMFFVSTFSLEASAQDRCRSRNNRGRYNNARYDRDYDRRDYDRYDRDDYDRRYRNPERTNGKLVTRVGIGAGVGALGGGLLGGGKGALIGAGVGAAIGGIIHKKKVNDADNRYDYRRR